MNIILDKYNSKNIMAAKLWINDGSRADPTNKNIHWQGRQKVYFLSNIVFKPRSAARKAAA